MTKSASPPHTFGGPWTEEKLELLRKYLSAYLQIFHKNEKARYYRTIYIDAFAGTGYRTPQPKAHQGAALPELGPVDEDVAQYFQGSASIALNLDPAFHRYIFVEQNPAYALALQDLQKQHPQKDITILNGDANTILKTWLPSQDWRRNRAVMFLDPYGTEVEWALLESIANTRAIDLWLLFPLSVLRMLPREHLPAEPLAQRLTRLLGTDEWQEAFYAPPPIHQLPLFAQEEKEQKERTVNWRAVGDFFLQRLDTIFHSVAKESYVLTNSKNVPLFLFCFAAGNPKGAPTAVKIAASILGAHKRRRSHRRF